MEWHMIQKGEENAMETLVCQIKKCIESKLEEGYREFIIFPFGDVGMQVKHILNDSYGIQAAYVLDNRLCVYNAQIKKLAFLGGIDCGHCCLILASTDVEIYDDLKNEVKKYFPERNIAELSFIFHWREGQERQERERKKWGKETLIGKYSYGPLCCNHPLIESIGAFCSFAVGTEVVVNHEIGQITTHPMIYAGVQEENVTEYAEYKDAEWYFEGVQPKADKIKKGRRIKIGNDVWLGRNVIVTNYANIGNGVIAGAGAIITKDIPDYAVVAGVPARIIRYRYSPQEIEALDKIAWWGWTDDEIRERYDDFYLPADEFIRKYL